MRNSLNATFSQSQKSHYARTRCSFLQTSEKKSTSASATPTGSGFRQSFPPHFRKPKRQCNDYRRWTIWWGVFCTNLSIILLISLTKNKKPSSIQPVFLVASPSRPWFPLCERYPFKEMLQVRLHHFLYILHLELFIADSFQKIKYNCHFWIFHLEFTPNCEG